ncbi:DUF4192 family protein [Kocuria sediminis]|uniref:DUF4192 family protein n=1 Tax=Kocuria sediminis TaxID=1038857 RepID=A0A6N8GPD4_9MICC|nr:DUF4192 family protein [Kocuria sediminis]MUN64150.1 DUF4192 family protein [Kocuria sediminis]
MRQHPTRDPFVPVVRCAADLLAVVPHTLGYWPAESLVLFAAGGGTAGACVRVDLPADPGDERFAEAFVAELAELVGHDALSDRVFAIVYTSGCASPGTPPPAGGPGAVPAVLAFVDEAARRADRAVAARWVVAGEHWWPVEDPEDVRDVARIQDSAVNAALVAAGSSYATAPRQAMDHEYGALPADIRRGVAGQAARWARAGRDGWHRLGRLACTLAVWEDVLTGVRDADGDWLPALLAHDDDLLGFLAAGLSDPVLADLLLAACATDDTAGVLAAAAMWAELCDGEHGPADAGDEPTGPTREAAPPGVAAVPRRPAGGGPGGDRPGASPGAVRLPAPDAGELIRLSRVLSGEWEETPAWPRLNALYRVLQALAWLLERGDAPAEPAAVEAAESTAEGTAEAAAGSDAPAARVVLAGVLVELAQLNRFRARGSHTAHFVRRATALVPCHPAALRVLRLADARPVPLWARDRATAWHS